MYFWFIRKHTQNSFDFNWPNLYFYINISVQFSCSVMSNSLWPHDLQHARPRCPSPTPGAYSNSCPLHWWCHPTISSSVFTFSSHLQSFPTSGSFPVSQFFTSGGQNIASFYQVSKLELVVTTFIVWFVPLLSLTYILSLMCLFLKAGR